MLVAEKRWTFIVCSQAWRGTLLSVQSHGRKPHIVWVKMWWILMTSDDESQGNNLSIYVNGWTAEKSRLAWKAVPLGLGTIHCLFKSSSLLRDCHRILRDPTAARLADNPPGATYEEGEIPATRQDNSPVRTSQAKSDAMCLTPHSRPWTLWNHYSRIGLPRDYHRAHRL